jgi:hypothetical protein
MRGLFVWLLLAQLVCASFAAYPPLNLIPKNTWFPIAPPETTNTCLNGTAFRFLVRLNSNDPSVQRLLIFFQGGGACWNTETCLNLYKDPVTCATVGVDAQGRSTDYPPAAINALLSKGIFDYDDARNPFKNFTTVFVPYCSGDIYMGSRANVPYGGGQTLNHMGAVNVKAVLTFLAGTGIQPAGIAMAGGSAGAYASVFWAPSINKIFPAARIVQMGDSGSGVFGTSVKELADQWGGVNDLLDPVIKNVIAAGGGLNRAYWAVMNTIPIRMSQLNHLQDYNQIQFYRATGGGAGNTREWKNGTLVNLAELDNYPGFSHFISSGRDHEFLMNDRFYTDEAGGLKVYQWVTRAVLGQFSTVKCADCDIASLAVSGSGKCKLSGGRGDVCGANDEGNCGCSPESSVTQCDDYWEVCIPTQCGPTDGNVE